jgi:hypothetical protein
VLITLQRKNLELRHLVVCKLAINSLDTHFILAKANEIHELFMNLLGQTQGFLKDKAKILASFEDLGSGSNAIQDLLNMVRVRFVELDAEISQWMQQKAEPNLVEVERKACKYKIKWESLRLHDKRSKLRAITQIRQMLTK